MRGLRIFRIAILVGVLLAALAFSGCAAPTDGEQAAGGVASFLPLIIVLLLVFGMFYFFMIRPLRQRERQHDRMVEELQPGDTVITAGGIFGQIEKIDEDSVVLKVESGATIRVTKGGVMGRPGGLR
ncbi:MAG: preprotein translocase subunit YajC [Chloroflexi bacterium]|nr:preprotein translocase subunit YajC [Chloroflexota bacterium]